MPDWSYRTVLGPALFALPPETGRRIAVRSLRILGSSAPGRWLIDLLGHMRAEPAAQMDLPETWVVGTVGLAALIDPHGEACAALSRFGVGFLELGPVAITGGAGEARWRRDADTQTVHSGHELAIEVGALARRLQAAPPVSAPLWIRIAQQESAPASVAVPLLAYTAAFLLTVPHDAPSAQTDERLASLLATASSDGMQRPVLLSLSADQPGLATLVQRAVQAGAAGVWLRGELTAVERSSGPHVTPQVLAHVQQLRACLPAHAVIVAGGVHAPDDARQLRAAGAQLVASEAGLVFSGPGLIKRCNEALASLQVVPSPAEPLSLRAARSAWFWSLMMGIAMLVGGALAFAIASTRVVLPYDEALCGLTRKQMMSVNPRLLPFMAHDRITLAGSMLSIGVLYTALAWHGVRRGVHWAHVTVAVSAFIGFLSMFSFFGFGYFDPLHAFVTAVLLQFLLLSLVAPASPVRPLENPEWHETAAWRRGQWGQLIFVVLGVGISVAGCVITYLGCSSVFVAEDLEFMRTTAARLAVAHERLVPLVAHDRASLGGMLVANGVALLLSSLWGFRAGAGWLWRALAWAGNLAFASAIGVHFVVGYNSVLHLAPAFAGWALWLLALGLSRAWLVGAPIRGV